MPCDYALYPAVWQEMRAAVLARAGNRCEGSPAYPSCRAENHTPHPITGSRVVLTIGHLYEDDHSTTDTTRLRAWCQRCHLKYDLRKHMERASMTRARRRAVAGQQPLLVVLAPAGAVPGAQGVAGEVG